MIYASVWIQVVSVLRSGLLLFKDPSSFSLHKFWTYQYEQYLIFMYIGVKLKDFDMYKMIDRVIFSTKANSYVVMLFLYNILTIIQIVLIIDSVFSSTYRKLDIISFSKHNTSMLYLKIIITILLLFITALWLVCFVSSIAKVPIDNPLELVPIIKS
ncbi:hypothetical protein NECID01_0008 [Nematocida sp. AWRm77]|nr:hypothetical protein NECID01_0008 [Nematocida sp. AWRm77]